MVDRIALLEAEKTAARLHGGIKVRRRQGETRQAERVRRIGLLRRNYPTPWPLIASIVARKCDGADNAVAAHDRAPHVKTKAGVVERLRCFECITQFSVSRQGLTSSRPC